MSIQGYVEYKRREFCKNINCLIQKQLDKQEQGSQAYEEIRNICKSNCIHSTYEFHHWLINQGYLLVKPEK